MHHPFGFRDDASESEFTEIGMVSVLLNLQCEVLDKILDPFNVSWIGSSFVMTFFKLSTSIPH